jgi:hypothetical protein
MHQLMGWLLTLMHPRLQDKKARQGKRILKASTLLPFQANDQD